MKDDQSTLSVLSTGEDTPWSIDATENSLHKTLTSSGFVNITFHIRFSLKGFSFS